MRAAKAEFLHVVRHAPIVAIDLIVRNARGEVLLGLRNNEPAANTWFVPGGRVLKDERLAAALERIALDELGVKVAAADARFRGPFEHLYGENFAGQPGLGTHYVVLAYETDVDFPPATSSSCPAPCPAPADDQHSEMRWWSPEELLASPDVHENTKAYFRA